MKFLRILSAAFAIVIAATVSSSAAPITFVIKTLDARGTLDGDVFGTSNVTVTATADTNNIVNVSAGIFAVEHATAMIDIAGVGVFSFLSPTRTFVNQGSQIVGFSRDSGGGLGGSDLLNGPVNAAFATWDMLSSIGPVAGNLQYLQWGSSAVNTSGGVLEFDNFTVQGTFEATVDMAPIPLPAGGMLLLTALGCGVVLRRRSA